MSILKRIFKIGEAEVNDAINGLENPIKMIEQGIRDLKSDLDKSLRALAEVKSWSIRANNDQELQKERAANYEKKALLLLKKGKCGELDEVEADSLASEALTRKESCLKLAGEAKAQGARFESHIVKMTGNIDRLKRNIRNYENELKTLKARVNVGESTKTMNRQLAKVDSGETVAMLERMQDKVNEEEALAEAYGEIAKEAGTVSNEVDKAIAESESKVKVAEGLEVMKRRLRLDEKKE